jgi:hypothetical protein
MSKDSSPALTSSIQSSVSPRSSTHTPSLSDCTSLMRSARTARSPPPVTGLGVGRRIGAGVVAVPRRGFAAARRAANHETAEREEAKRQGPRDAADKGADLRVSPGRSWRAHGSALLQGPGLRAAAESQRKRPHPRAGLCRAARSRPSRLGPATWNNPNCRAPPRARWGPPRSGNSSSSRRSCFGFRRRTARLRRRRGGCRRRRARAGSRPCIRRIRRC